MFSCIFASKNFRISKYFMQENINIEIGQRIRESIEKRFGKRGNAAFARMLGISPTSLNEYVQGKMKPGNKMQERLREIGEDVEYIMTGQRKPILESNIVPARGKMYKVIISVNAGNPDCIFREDNYTGEEMFFPFEKERGFAVKVIGDSMTNPSGKSINDGDYVFVDMDASVLSGDVVVINLHSGRQMIKQYIQGENDEIILRSFNPQHPDIKIKYSEVITMFRILASASLNRF